MSSATDVHVSLWDDRFWEIRGEGKTFTKDYSSLILHLLPSWNFFVCAAVEKKNLTPDIWMHFSTLS